MLLTTRLDHGQTTPTESANKESHLDTGIDNLSELFMKKKIKH